MSKLSADRKWWLRQWERGGWSIGNPMKASVKKWREHTRALLKAGLLEGEPDLGPNWSSPMCRITDAGLSALREQS